MLMACLVIRGDAFGMATSSAPRRNKTARHPAALLAGHRASGALNRPDPFRASGTGATRQPAYPIPKALAAFLTSRAFTQRSTPYRPIPAHTASVAVTLILAAASLAKRSDMAP